MAFKIAKSASVSLESPEALFRDIKTKKIPGPLVDQADLWRAYLQEGIEKTDVALQLPTGAGKTLVGLVLSEWRRRKFNERVVFLCPTKQLVHQVSEQAIEKYGIKVNAFTGSHRQYNKDAVSEYINCERVAVTSYSSLFNSRPFFDSPHIIILDDAHSSEQYIASQWALSIDSNDSQHKPLYDAIVGLLRNLIAKPDYQRLISPEASFRDKNWVDKLASPVLDKLIPDLVATCDAIIGNQHYEVTEHKFSWRAVRDHLHACHLYLAAGHLLLRPLLAPTNTHRPFYDAKQRIYMSATFGEAGELERISGRPNIHRIRTNGAWDRQTIGRRYFLFPERSLDEDDQLRLLKNVIKKAGRSLVLTPDGLRERTFREFVKTEIGYPTFSAQDIETSKENFISKNNAVAIVANRYDGIDFPLDQCRVAIFEGLPRATNLQEQFLIFKVGAVDLLNSRITTRLVQAFGRCTRADQDYSAIIVRGEELNKHLMTPERRALLHPELHAEILFGIEQSKGCALGEFEENLDIFLAQGDSWREANDDIIEKRDSLSQEKMKGAEELAKSAPIEIEYLSALWNKNYSDALDCSRRILALLNEPKLRGYRALWHYLAGSAAAKLSSEGKSGFDAMAREQFSSALKAERGLTWLIPYATSHENIEATKRLADDRDSWSVIERLESLFDSLGTLTDSKYERFEADVRAKLAQDDHKSFEEGHAKLGKLLGYESGNRNNQGSPDPWWTANDSFCFIFEDHSESKSTSTLSVEKARQVCTHPNWAKENLDLSEKAEIHAVLVTRVTTADTAALTHLKSVLVWPIDDFRSWASNAISVIREIRNQYPNAGDLAWRAHAAEKLEAAAITPRALWKKLSKNIGAIILKKP